MRLFKWFKRKVIPSNYSTKDNPLFMPKFGLIIPHTKDAQGATSFDGKYSEYIYGGLMADIVGIPATTRNLGGVYGAAETLYEMGINATIEPHANAYNGQASGCEILVLNGDKLSERFAREMIDYFAECYPDRKLRADRGIKLVSKGSRGAGNLIAAKNAGMKVAVLTELHFIDNPLDFMKISDQANFWKGFLEKYEH